jgi:bifunctional enzyme CysN/CysC
MSASLPGLAPDADGRHGRSAAPAVSRYAFDVTVTSRAARLRQRPCVVWFTGLSGAGKSTIANGVERALSALGHHTYVLDGDDLRHGLNSDLGFSAADRDENVRRAGEVAALLFDAGLIVLVCLISPSSAGRAQARARVQPGGFCEVFVDAPLAVVEARDTKGLYGRARRGEVRDVTGLDAPYDVPERPDVHINSAVTSPAGAVAQVVAALRQRGLIRTPLTAASRAPENRPHA